MLPEAWKKPAALERLLHRRWGRPVTQLSSLPVPQAWASKTTTCFNQHFSLKSRRLYSLLGIPRVPSPTIGHNRVQPFLCTQTLMGWGGSLLWFWILLWNSIRTLIIQSSSPLPHFLGGGIPLPILAEVLFWIRFFFIDRLVSRDPLSAWMDSSKPLASSQ